MKLKTDIVINNFRSIEDYTSPFLLGDGVFPLKPVLYIYSKDKIKKGKYKFKYMGFEFKKCKIVKTSKNNYIALEYNIKGKSNRIM